MPRKIILVADGNDDCRIIYSTILQHAGFVVLEARTGAEALEMIPTHMPDAVVSELTLRIVDGRELLRRIKQNPETAHTPVLIVTADSRPEVRVELAADCAAFLVKPCAPNRLLQAVREVVEEQRISVLGRETMRDKAADVQGRHFDATRTCRARNALSADDIV